MADGEAAAMRVAIVAADLGHYHHARISAAVEETGFSFLVLSTKAESSFPEFSSGVSRGTAYPIVAFDWSRLGREAPGRLQQELQKFEPQVVVVPGWAFAPALVAIRWAQSNDVKVVVLSESQARDSARNRLAEYAKRSILRMCDAALVGGRTHRDYLIALGVSPPQIFLGYDAVDNLHFQLGSAEARANGTEVRRRLGLPSRYFLASGRFIAKKNFPNLVRAYALACQENERLPELMLLGDGPERAVVESAVRETGITERVKFLGFQPYDRLPALYALAEAFLHVSLSEQWGLVVNEAAACGLPVVVSQQCGSSWELVEVGTNGFIVDAENNRQIASAILSLGAMETSRRVEMGQASQVIVGEWGASRYASGLASACRAALSKSKSAASLLDRMLLQLRIHFDRQNF